ncbi:hypothetical protein QTG54_009319 [Skeletonema marinoi]|uniref:Uncharacterized protein n=1 Tax=Skeletonema marinoi TaxID=267567 RepID=A0AAD9DBX8_9STRA|nr:hypothetical protein QTG54_009319 [Skeletonema marinoi]
MSFDVQVKDEPEMNDDFDVETDSETEEEIEVDKLQPLDPKFASLLKFPIGCKVWYDLFKSTKPTKCLQAKSAYVEEAYIHFENRKQVYKVKSEITEHEATPLYEDKLVYGANCPVTVSNPDTNEVRNGVIICPKLDQGHGDGKQRVSYAVQFWQGEKVSIEFGVAAERVKYRMEENARTDDGRKGGRVVAAAAEGNEEIEVSSNVHKEIGTGELTTNNVGGIVSPEAHNSPDQEIEGEEEGEVVETKVGEGNKMLEHKRTSVTEVDERPKKVAKTTSKEEECTWKECTCALNLPLWIKDRRRLFRHILGVDENGEMGHKTRQITSATTCWVSVSINENREPMTITIKCFSSVTQSRPGSNVTKAIDMIEDSIVEFLADRDSEKKLLYELAVRATGSYKFPYDHGFVQRKYDGVRKWCRIIDLPCKWREGSGGDHEKCLQDLKTLQRNECEIEVFDGKSRPAPYVMICGAKKKDVKKITSEVFNAVKSHQSKCNCRPKW